MSALTPSDRVRGLIDGLHDMAYETEKARDYLRFVLQGGDWRDYRTPDGMRVQHTDFAEFIDALSPRGLSTAMTRITPEDLRALGRRPHPDRPARPGAGHALRSGRGGRAHRSGSPEPSRPRGAGRAAGRALDRGERSMTPSDRAADALRARFAREKEQLHADGYLTIDDAAALLGAHRDTVSRMISDGRLSSTRVDDRVVTRQEWIDAVPDSRRTAAQWRRRHGYLSTAEAAAELRITRQALQVRIQRGQQLAVRAGADAPVPEAWLIRAEDVGRAA
ncbi:excisionase family DNA-binding protein [Mycobacteroides abscessus]|uniref:excisionase family DNA-binding protein n=1 Tax=Mycobacteroides abscessus TaxID=36809 RepID=UPI0009A741A6|nr:helix-turn-helix domain-containing protein [Mycobacteroides abscessus]